MNDIYQALARTALLIEVDIFPGTDHEVIIDGLRATTARIISNRANITSPAGQTVLVTLYALLAMLGLQIDLDIPAAARLTTDQPPLRGSDLVASLLDYSADLLPGGSAQPSPIPDVTFALGDTPAPSGTVRVSGTGWTGAVGLLAPAPSWQGIWPAGAMAAAAAAAAEGLRAAVPRIADRAGPPLPTAPRWRAIPGRQVTLDLGRYRADGPIQLGAVDVISGGAITNAALYALLRMPAAHRGDAHHRAGPARPAQPEPVRPGPQVDDGLAEDPRPHGLPDPRHSHHWARPVLQRRHRGLPRPDRAAAAGRGRPHPVPLGRPARRRSGLGLHRFQLP